VSDEELPNDRDFFKAAFRWLFTGESKLEHEPREEAKDEEEGPQVIEAEGQEVHPAAQPSRRA
jgi:hypothetical protein